MTNNSFGGLYTFLVKPISESLIKINILISELNPPAFGETRVEKEVDVFFLLISSWQLVKMFWWSTAGLSRGQFKELTHIDERLHLKTHLECVCVYFVWMFLIPCVISRKDRDLKCWLVIVMGIWEFVAYLQLQLHACSVLMGNHFGFTCLNRHICFV